MEFIKPDININFVAYRRIAMAISGLVVIASIVAVLVVGFNFGIEFAGGIEMRVKVSDNVTAKDLRAALSELGLNNAIVNEYVDLVNVYSIKLKGSELEDKIHRANESEPEAVTTGKKLQADAANVLIDSLTQKFGKGHLEVVSTDMIGSRVGETLRIRGIQAILASLIAMLIYIGIRFNFRYAPGAVVALAHDVIIVTGLMVLMHREFTLSVIAALLTIAGYSINDTIIVFDRIREAQGLSRGQMLPTVVNRAINQTLSRTILTSATTLVVVVALFILGGEILRDFALAMILGIGVGTYSSIFIASPIFIELEEIFAARKPKAKRR